MSETAPEPTSSWKKLRASIGTMPALSHNPTPDKPWSADASEVTRWLHANLGEGQILELLFLAASRNGLIIYDRETRLWHGVSSDELQTRKASREARKAERVAAAKLARETRVRTGKVWHRPGHPPGRQRTVTWPTMIVDKLDAFVDEKGYAPSTGELRDYIAGDRVCSPATYFRALEKARADGVVIDVREVRDGRSVKVLHLATSEQKTTPPPAPVFAQAGDDEPL